MFQNTVQTGGKFTGSGTGNSSSQTPSKVNPGLNFGFTIDGIDINLYNYAPYTDYNSTGGSWSGWYNVPLHGVKVYHMFLEVEEEVQVVGVVIVLQMDMEIGVSH